MPFHALAVQLGVNLGMWAINKYVFPPDAAPRPLAEEFEFTQARVGSPVPLIYGTVLIENPVLAWHGNEIALLYERNFIEGDMSPTFHYGLDALLIIGTPPWDEAGSPWASWRATYPPKVLRFWYDNNELNWGPLFYTGVNVDPLVHGVPQQFLHASSTSVQTRGMAQFFDGRPDQLITNYPLPDPDPVSIDFQFGLAGEDRSLIPGYRNTMVLAILASGGIGTAKTIGLSSRLAAFRVEVTCVGPENSGPTGEFGEPGGVEANPAWVLYDMLCRPVWGLGISTTLVDLASFQAAATTLVTEEHGCSIAVQQIDDVSRVFSTLLDQIDGVIFEDESTGKIKLKLIRNDYVVGDLPEMTIDNTIGRPEVTWTSPRNTINTLRVHYTSRENDYKTSTVTARRLANAVGQSNLIKVADFQVPGCTTKVLAQRIADRELGVMGRPLMTVTCSVNRFFYELQLGDPVLANWPAIDIVDKVFRILEVDHGQHADGAIRLSLIEDVFDQG